METSGNLSVENLLIQRDDHAETCRLFERVMSTGIRVALIFNLRFLFLTPPNTVPFHKKILLEKDYCNRTTGKGADQALKFRIRQ